MGRRGIMSGEKGDHEWGMSGKKGDHEWGEG